MSLLLVKDVENKIIRTSKYMFAYICINNIKSDKLIIARFLVKIYLIDNFSVNLFIDIDVIALQIIIFNFKKHTIYIDSYKVVASINIITGRNTYIKQTIYVKRAFIILFEVLIQISIIYYNKLFIDRNFLFELRYKEHLD